MPEIISPTCLTSHLYGLLTEMPRQNHLSSLSQLPTSGIYIFFEKGEIIDLPSGTVDRIVRIGTHNKDGRFRDRIRQHYGLVNSLGGNKNGSVFRKHLGGSLLRRLDPDDPRLSGWEKQMGPSYPEVEVMVSTELRGRFTFVCLRVDSCERRR